jgi:abortive infection bacteriophage resistance protein
MKTFKTLSEQKLYLIKNKNLIDEDIIDRILYERPYASLINPYKKFFYTSVDGNLHVYKDKVSITDYYKLATLDDLIAKELNDHIGIFERRIKGAFAYVISERMNSTGDHLATSYIDIFNHLDEKIEHLKFLGFNDYRSTYDKRAKKIVEVSDKTKVYRKNLLMSIATLDDVKKKKNKLFQKYIVNNQPIPFWLVVHTLSLGDLVSLYQMLGKELRNSILKYLADSIEDSIFKDTVFKFEQDLNIIKELRNIINHYEPLYEFIRSVPKSKFLHGINRVESYAIKFMDVSIDNIIDNLPKFKNKDNDSMIDIYTELIKITKKKR